MTTTNIINVNDNAAVAACDAMTMDATTTKGAKGTHAEATASELVALAKAERFGRTALMGELKTAIAAHTIKAAKEGGALTITISADVVAGASMADAIKALKAGVKDAVETTGVFVASFVRPVSWAALARLNNMAAKAHKNAGAVDAIAFADAFCRTCLEYESEGVECTPETTANVIAYAKKASTKDGAKKAARMEAQRTAVENAANNKAAEIARNLKAAGVAAEIIAMTTGMTIDAINAI